MPPLLLPLARGPMQEPRTALPDVMMQPLAGWAGILAVRVGLTQFLPRRGQPE